MVKRWRGLGLGLRLGFGLSLGCLLLVFAPTAASAWGYQGHRVVGSIADTLLLGTNAGTQVQQILNPPGSHDPSPGHQFDLRKAGPWADCVKSVKQTDHSFKYTLSDSDPEYELPCIPFSEERGQMDDYAERNWTTCVYPADADANHQQGCHNTFHFDDVAVQRNGFDRTHQGTNPHDLVAAIGAAIAVLSDKPISTEFAFSIKDKREALLLLTHFIGDLHQPLHVGALYLDPSSGALIDPDAQHVDATNDTVGGNSIQDQNINLHAEWDNIPPDLGDMQTPGLITAANQVPPSTGPIEDWPVVWASDTIQVSHQAFAGLTFSKDPSPAPGSHGSHWIVTFDDHAAYLTRMDQIKRQQLAKAGARLAQILLVIFK